MKKNTNPIVSESYYHIYNRGINGEVLFKEKRNYAYFLEKFATHISPIADTFAYCLMGNHFHFLIRTKSEREITQFYLAKPRTCDSNMTENKPTLTCSAIISNQFAILFNAYCQSINKANNRTGGLFERPFRRIEVTDNDYLSYLIAYIHQNPQRHKFVKDFKTYPHSSYCSHLSESQTHLQRTEVIEWFGSKQAYVDFHEFNNDFQQLDSLMIEFD